MAADDRLTSPVVSHLASSLPNSDRSSLVELGDDDIQSWTAARAEEYRAFARTLLSIYNAVTPIHHLPAEILSKIFQQCWTRRESLRIGHVCCRWRAVLLDTKRFWADAVKDNKFTPDNRSTGYIEAMLERSAPRMVEPSFSSFSTDVSQCLARHSGRVVSLEVTCVTSNVLSPLWACLNSGMPCLATLTIKLDEGDYRWIMKAPAKGLALSLSPTALPRLTRVSAPVRLFSSLYLPSLQHATLHNPITREYEHGRLGSRSFFTTLALCAPHLETLSLREATPWLFHTTTPLALPALRHLHVQDVARRCDLLLHCLTFPPMARIHCANIDGLGLCLTAPFSAASVQLALSTTDRVAIVTPAGANAICVHCYARDDSEALLRVDVGPPTVSTRAADRLCPRDVYQFFYGLAPVTQLTVATHSCLDMQGVVEWRAFPHLVRAEISGWKRMHALTNLARQLDGESAGAGPAAAVCPELKVLVVDFIHDVMRTFDLSGVLRGGDVAMVEADLRERCANLERVLSFRSEMGSRLTRLEFGCTESGWSDGAGGCKSTLDPLGADWTSWRPIVEPLKKLVDGPVVFTGYRQIRT